MLIYNKELSVCPITTHLPLKRVTNQIKKKNIIEKINFINEFYKKNLKKKPSIGILGLNPHCESVEKYKEDDRIIKPLVKKLIKKNLKFPGLILQILFLKIIDVILMLLLECIMIKF